MRAEFFRNDRSLKWHSKSSFSAITSDLHRQILVLVKREGRGALARTSTAFLPPPHPTPPPPLPDTDADGRYASCGHVGGLCCLLSYHIFLQIDFLQTDFKKLHEQFLCNRSVYLRKTRLNYLQSGSPFHSNSTAIHRTPVLKSQAFSSTGGISLIGMNSVLTQLLW